MTRVTNPRGSISQWNAGRRLKPCG